MGLGKRLPSTSRICLAKDDDRTCVLNNCGQNCGKKAGLHRRTHLASTSTPWKKSAFIPGMSSQELRGHFGPCLKPCLRSGKTVTYPTDLQQPSGLGFGSSWPLSVSGFRLTFPISWKISPL